MIDIITFHGKGKSSEEAMLSVAQKLSNWYSAQKVRFVTTGASVFQFSTALTYAWGEFHATITVFDIRNDISSPVTRVATEGDTDG